MLKENEFIKVDPKGTQRFVYPDGSYYTPIGVNYFCRGTGWAPHIWYDHHTMEFDRDFSRMQALGINTIRVFTSIATLVPELYTINETTLGYIREMLEYAAKYDIRVIFSGLSFWDGAPAWMNDLSPEDKYYFTGDKMLAQLAFGWYHLARTCAPYSSLFSYDLQNEPFLDWDQPGVKKWHDYCIMRGAEDGVSPEIAALLMANKDAIPDGSSYDGNPALILEYQRYRNVMCRRYIKTCTDAIRAADGNHMISIGLHQRSFPTDVGSPAGYASFDPRAIGDLLDYVSIHFYPFDDTMDIADDLDSPEGRVLGGKNFKKCVNQMCAHINYCDIGKPVVLEEYGLYGGGVAPGFSWRKPFKYLPQSASADWANEVIRRNRMRCSGFLIWGFDDAPDQGDPTRYQGLYDDEGNIKELGKIYPTLIAETRAFVEANPAYIKKTPIRLDHTKLMTDGKYIAEMYNDIMEHLEEKDEPYFVVE